MQAEIRRITEKKFVGLNQRMSLANNMTGKLWSNFMTRRKDISNRVTNELFSLQIYEPSYFEKFNANNEFEKWALAEVTSFEIIPEGMHKFLLEEGLYAVFHYKGLNTDTRIFEYIFNNWLPRSNYSLDNRPHFEILGEKYINNDPNSEEEIWIPIKLS